MRIVYLDCFSGISGDMFLGALVDAGVSPALLEKTVADLNLDAKLEITRVDRSGITATKVDVILAGEKDVPREVFHAAKMHAAHLEHDHEHHHAHEHDHEHGHDHSPEHDHGHGHSHSHGRSLKEIRHLIAHVPISETAKQRATAIFEALGRAESKIHNVDLESIHFHEVGSVDAIVDIICAAVGSDALGVDRWICSPLNVGGGTVVCAHGTFPIPAPATVELLKSRYAPVYSSGIQKELVTPTGAAIVSVLADEFAPFPPMKLETTGYGAGYRDIEKHANVVRLTIGESVSQSTGAAPFPKGGCDSNISGCAVDTVSVLEATLDDMTPELLGHFIDQALAAGALDAYIVPVQMKKTRPGMLLTVLARTEDRDRITQLIFTETTTIGLRVRDEQRYVLPRRIITVQTQWGDIRIKLATLDGVVANCAPEYEDCRRVAAQHKIPLKHVMQEAIRIYLQSSDQHHHG
jgi:pyridinium-3,5-bisthiocarboxylic acid mononucleotide nickel chelatase